MAASKVVQQQLLACACRLLELLSVSSSKLPYTTTLESSSTTAAEATGRTPHHITAVANMDTVSLATAQYLGMKLLYYYTFSMRQDEADTSAC
jgi:hypothetical protein